LIIPPFGYGITSVSPTGSPQALSTPPLIDAAGPPFLVGPLHPYLVFVANVLSRIHLIINDLQKSAFHTFAGFRLLPFPAESPPSLSLRHLPWVYPAPRNLERDNSVSYLTEPGGLDAHDVLQAAPLPSLFPLSVIHRPPTSPRFVATLPRPVCRCGYSSPCRCFLFQVYRSRGPASQSFLPPLFSSRPSHSPSTKVTVCLKV